MKTQPCDSLHHYVIMSNIKCGGAVSVSLMRPLTQRYTNTMKHLTANDGTHEKTIKTYEIT